MSKRRITDLIEQTNAYDTHIADTCYIHQGSVQSNVKKMRMSSDVDTIKFVDSETRNFSYKQIKDVRNLLEAGRFDQLEMAIKKGWFDINKLNTSGNTLLHTYSSAEYFNPIIVKWLLEHNIDYTITNKREKLPILFNFKVNFQKMLDLRMELLNSSEMPVKFKNYMKNLGVQSYADTCHQTMEEISFEKKDTKINSNVFLEELIDTNNSGIFDSFLREFSLSNSEVDNANNPESSFFLGW
ncbi:MAG: hypothetical protein DGJ47_000242 [Rickettsiaceae bacterium]